MKKNILFAVFFCLITTIYPFGYVEFIDFILPQSIEKLNVLLGSYIVDVINSDDDFEVSDRVIISQKDGSQSNMLVENINLLRDLKDIRCECLFFNWNVPAIKNVIPQINFAIIISK